MVTNNLTTQDVMEKGESLNFPESVQSLFRGDIGQPEGGWPEELQKLILKDEKPFTDRPNEHLAPIDFDKEWEAFQDQIWPPEPSSPTCSLTCYTPKYLSNTGPTCSSSATCR